MDDSRKGTHLEYENDVGDGLLVKDVNRYQIR